MVYALGLWKNWIISQAGKREAARLKTCCGRVEPLYRSPRFLQFQVAGHLGANLAVNYSPCRSARLERGFEKIAIYARGKQPTYVAKQLTDGRWKSKLGPEEDIVHNSLKILEGPCYVKAVRFLKRPMQK